MATVTYNNTLENSTSSRVFIFSNGTGMRIYPGVNTIDNADIALLRSLPLFLSLETSTVMVVSDSTIPPITPPITPPTSDYSGSLGFDCMVVIGQSNAEGNGTEINPLLDYTDPRVSMYSPGTYQYANTLYLAQNKIVNIQGEYDNTKLSFALGFARLYLAENPLKRVCLIGCSLGNTGYSSSHWKVGDPLYNSTVEVCNRFLVEYPNSKIKAFLWHQGERDIDNSLPGVDYRNFQEAMISGLRTSITGCTNVPFVNGNYSPDWSIGFPNKIAIEAANFSITRRIDYTANVLTTGLSGNPGGDSIHMDSRSLRILSKRYYEGYKSALLNKLTVPQPPTNITFTALSASAIQVNFTQDTKADYSNVSVNSKTYKIYSLPFIIPNLSASTTYTASFTSTNNLGASNVATKSITTNSTATPAPTLHSVKLTYENANDLVFNDSLSGLGFGANGILKQATDIDRGKVLLIDNAAGLVSYSQLPNEISFMTWVKIYEYRDAASLLSLPGGDVTGRLQLKIPNAAPIGLYINDVAQYVDATIFPLNTWVNVGFTIGGGQAKIYKNGLKVASVAKAYTHNSDKFWIGQLDFGYGSIRGNLDNTYLFNRVLSENEMLKLYEISF